MITQEKVQELLLDIESDCVEKTQSAKDADKIGEAICAFSNDFPDNKRPGYLLIGADDKGKRTKFAATDEILRNLGEFRTNGNIVPPPAMSVQKFSWEDGDIVVVEVLPSPNPPVRYKQRIYIRVGPRKAIANETEERRLNEKRSHFLRSFDATPCYGSVVADMSRELFTINYLPLAVDAETIEANHRDVHQQLASLKLYDTTAQCPTNAGILLFGKNPLFFLPGAYIQYIRFAGKGMESDIVAEKKFSGDLLTQLRVLDDFVKGQILRERPVYETVLREKSVYNYPYKAVRELLMNAILHRDYQSNAPVKLYEFSDRIEIANPGGLYGSANRENFPNVNDYRNPNLAEALKNLGYVNKFNRGIAVARAESEKNGNPLPKFDIDDGGVFLVQIFSAWQ